MTQNSQNRNLRNQDQTLQNRVFLNHVSDVHVINNDYSIWRGCLRKRRYSCLSDAVDAANRTGHGNPYYCDNCYGFHVGKSAHQASSASRVR